MCDSVVGSLLRTGLHNCIRILLPAIVGLTALPLSFDVSASCSLSSDNTILTCSGDESGGINVNDISDTGDVTTLNVTNLTESIEGDGFGIYWDIPGDSATFSASIDTGNQSISNGNLNGNPAIASLQLFSQGEKGSDDGDHGKHGSTITGSAFSGTISTGDNAGILIASLGGKGHEGGKNHTGGYGGHGGDVALSVSGSITATGGPGILLASVGGKGGEGGGSDGSDAGSGGNGGYAQSVTLSTIGTTSVDAQGVAPLIDADGNIVTDSKGHTVYFGPGVMLVSLAGEGGEGQDGSSKGGWGGCGGNTQLKNHACGDTRGNPDDMGSISLDVGGDATPVWHVTTSGSTNAAGFWLESNGGNGSEAGESGSLSARSGGNGGTGGEITVGSAARTVTTQGTQSPGFYAASFGGHGGKGGASPLAGSGGDGGSGGAAGDISVDGSYWSITTNGDQSAGINLYSLGGYGGEGGDGGWGSGGTGGNTGTGGMVTLTVGADCTGDETCQTSVVTTTGVNSPGIIAQSIGGYGGDAGNSYGLVAFGANGGSGSDGGAVTVTNNANITTTGDGSDGLKAHSIGGGGGSGGFAFGAFYSESGNGSAGGEGSAVTVNNNGQITVSGNDAHGILAQSIGGTGGDGGAGGSVLLALGGRAAQGSDGGDVTVNNSGTIATGSAPAGTAADPDDQECGSGCSAGILAQSIGGGGGHAGSVGGWFSIGAQGGGGGQGGNVSVNSANADITTSLDNSSAIIAQSIGGGGGHGGGSIAVGLIGSFAIGGTGGTGGSAETALISVDGSQTISTSGDNSHGLFAQSIGGGGGNGGFATASAIGLVPETTTVAVAVGGSGDTGGNGGNVSLWVNATDYLPENNQVVTVGNGSIGLFAQSIGGGGGSGGVAVATSVELNDFPAFDFAVGGSGKGGGSGGVVDVVSTTEITTHGDKSGGIVAQSIGGGGGNGGTTVSTNVGMTGVGLSFGLGGSSGNGGTGGAVTVTSFGSITTHGDSSAGLLAQSIGGGGGNGGLDVSTSAVVTGTTLNLGLGGSGGNGGSSVDSTEGIAVTVDIISGDITTHGENSDAIIAQSIGGGGGNGGMNISSTVDLAMQKGQGAFTIGVGGFAGDGGKGGNVMVCNGIAVNLGCEETIGGKLTTSGAKSDGILAQSIGGGGGSGALSISTQGSLGSFSPGSAMATVGVGGNGGSGGDSGWVVVANDRDIQVTGVDSSGIVAQSIGGGGGQGGATYAGQLQIAPTQVSFGLGIGGSGSDGGAANSVNVTNFGKITTGSDTPRTTISGYGIFAQSIGGGGGHGGNSSTGQLAILGADNEGKSLKLDIGVGGAGGTGNTASTVEIRNYGDISTIDHGAHALLAQSIGGGGGVGGSSVSFDVSAVPSKSPSIILSADVGGNGGSGGNADTVWVYNYSESLTTMGDGANAIFAQSIGGGGGIAGQSGTHNFSFPRLGADDWSLTLDVGGNGGAGGDGGQVTIENHAAIHTTGKGSSGIYAQSIGAGGGHGGDEETQWVDLPPFELRALYSELTISLGGQGGASGDGELVEITHSGDITTEGTNASGIYAQSIGGGGGKAGNTGLGLFQGGFVLGGTGGTAGDGGAVTINFQSGTISTSGSSNDESSDDSSIDYSTLPAESYGIFAQSIGGGGGHGGKASLGHWTHFGWAVDVGGVGGTAGDGDKVTITADGDIVTTGHSSIAIYAQSVGGGGGLAGAASASASVIGDIWSGSTGGSGSSGTVDVTVGGKVTTSGDFAHGIFAQSIAGKAESNGNYGSAGKVTVTVNGAVHASGGGAHGIYAQSKDYDNNGQVNITVNEQAIVSGGTVAPEADALTGANNGVGIVIQDGSSNTITNKGTITSVDGSTGLAIVGVNTSITVSNSGTITGSVCKDGSSACNTLIYSDISIASAFQGNDSVITLDNEQEGIVASGSVLDIDQFTNRGTLDIGGLGSIGSTLLTGDYVQTGEGATRVDLDLSAPDSAVMVDMLTIAGDAHLEGRVDINYLNVASGNDAFQTVTIAHVVGDRSAQTADLLQVAPSVVAQPELVYPNANDINLNYQIDYANDRVLANTNRNQFNVARHIQGIFNTGALHEYLAGLVEQPSISGYVNALDGLNPDVYAFNQMSTLYSIEDFNSSMRSCRLTNAQYRFSEQGQCGWLRVQGRQLDTDGTSHRRGFDESAFQLAGGGQFQLDDNWFIGGAVGFEQRRLTGNSEIDSDGAQIQAGVVVKKQFGQSLVAASLAGGVTNYDVDRKIAPNMATSGEQDLGFASLSLDASHVFEQGDLYWKPRVGISASYLSMDDMTESGAGDLDMTLKGESDFYYNVQAGVEFGGETKRSSGLVIRPSAYLGVTQYLGGHSPGVVAAFDSGPANVAPIVLDSDMDSTYIDAAAGVELLSGNEWAVGLNVFGQRGSNTRMYGGSVKASVSF